MAAGTVVQFRERRRHAGEARVETLAFIDEVADGLLRARKALVRGDLVGCYREMKRLFDLAIAARIEYTNLTGGAA